MEKHGDSGGLDLHSLRREFAGPPALPHTAPRPVQEEEERSLADRAVDALIPLMIFSMMLAVMWFLLDLRFVFTERLDLNMRAFAFFFVMGIVALNRLRAERGEMDSAVYMTGMIFAVGVFSVVSQLRGGGMAGGMMTSMLPSLCFNVSVVAILWKVTDRLTRDCCVDGSARYGEVGLLRGGWFRKPPPADAPPDTPLDGPEHATRLPRRHPANSLFYLAIPIMILLAIGQRLLPGGGPLMESAGSVYVGAYTVSMLMLLMLSSYRGLRVYCQRRAIHFPTSIAAFWLGLGTLMVALVLVLGLWGLYPVNPPRGKSRTDSTTPRDAPCPRITTITSTGGTAKRAMRKVSQVRWAPRASRANPAKSGNPDRISRASGNSPTLRGKPMPWNNPMARPRRLNGISKVRRAARMASRGLRLARPDRATRVVHRRRLAPMERRGDRAVLAGRVVRVGKGDNLNPVPRKGSNRNPRKAARSPLRARRRLRLPVPVPHHPARRFP